MISLFETIIELNNMPTDEIFNYCDTHKTNFMVNVNVEHVDYVNSYIVLDEKVEIFIHSDYKIQFTDLITSHRANIVSEKLWLILNKLFIKLDMELSIFDYLDPTTCTNDDNISYIVDKSDFFGILISSLGTIKYPSFRILNNNLYIEKNNTNYIECVKKREIIGDTAIWTETEHYTIIFDYKTHELTLFENNKIFFNGRD